MAFIDKTTRNLGLALAAAASQLTGCASPGDRLAPHAVETVRAVETYGERETALRDTLRETAQYLESQNLFCGGGKAAGPHGATYAAYSGNVLQSSGQTPVRCAVIDTGFDAAHPAFQNKIHSFYRPQDNGRNLEHGTNVAGVLALYGPSNVTLDLYAVAVGPSDKSTNTVTEAAGGFVQALTLANDSPALFINLSMQRTGGAFEREIVSALMESVQRGKVVVISGGNAAGAEINAFDKSTLDKINSAGCGEVILSGMQQGNKTKTLGNQIFYIPTGTVLVANPGLRLAEANNSSSFNAPMIVADLVAHKNRHPEMTGKQLVQCLREESNDLGHSRVGNGFLAPRSAALLAFNDTAWDLMSASQRQSALMQTDKMLRSASFWDGTDKERLSDLRERLASHMTPETLAQKNKADNAAQNELKRLAQAQMGR